MRPASWLCQQQLSQDTVWGHMQVCGSAARALQSSLAWDSCNPVAVRTEMEYDTVLGTQRCGETLWWWSLALHLAGHAGSAADSLSLQGGRQQAAGQQASADTLAWTMLTRMQQEAGNADSVPAVRVQGDMHSAAQQWSGRTMDRVEPAGCCAHSRRSLKSLL